MALPMTRPTPHPKTRVYRVRQEIPKHLRAITKRDHGRSSEFIETLATKDPAEAKRRAPAVIEKFSTWLRAAQAEHDGQNVHLSDREVSALIGRWLASQEATDHDLALRPAQEYEDWRSDLADILSRLDRGDDAANSDALTYAQADIAPLLALQGLNVDADTMQRLAIRLLWVQWKRYGDLAERARSGCWVTSVASTDFAKPQAQPHLSSLTPYPADKPACTIDALLSGWALDRGWRLDVKPLPRGLYDRVRTMERFAEFIGHRDASKVVKADVVRLKGEMMGRGLNAATVRNDLSELSAIWKWGVANGQVGHNPFDGTLPPKPAKKEQERRAFTDVEAATVLKATRSELGLLRWLPWVLCLTGARLNEVCQSQREDITVMDGVTVLRLHDDGDGRSLKNAESRRAVPLHPALVAEGFVDYVATLPPGSPLFPDVEPDGVFGQRAPNAGKEMSKWLKKSLKLTDPAISPNHSWRHWFIGACRRVVMPPEVRSAITGHSAKLDESAGYGDGMKTFIVVLAEHIARVPVPPGV